MTNLIFDMNITKDVLTTEELIILKTIYSKVEKAQKEKDREKLAKELKEAVKSKEGTCKCIKCSIRKLKAAIDNTSEEVTPELIEHFWKSIVGNKGPNIDIAAFGKQKEEEPQSNTKKQKEEPNLEDLGELILGFLAVEELLSLVSSMKK